MGVSDKSGEHAILLDLVKEVRDDLKTVKGGMSDGRERFAKLEGRTTALEGQLAGLHQTIADTTASVVRRTIREEKGTDVQARALDKKNNTVLLVTKVIGATAAAAVLIIGAVFAGLKMWQTAESQQTIQTTGARP